MLKAKVIPGDLRWDYFFSKHGMSLTGVITKEAEPKQRIGAERYHRFVPDTFGSYTEYECLLFREDELVRI